MSSPFAAPTENPQETLSKGGGDFVPLSAFGKQGRLVLIAPMDLDRNVESQFPDEKTGEKKFGPQLKANFALLTGESEISWPGKDESGKDIMRTHEAEIDPGKSACVLDDVLVYSAPLIDRTEDARRVDVASTMTLGRLHQPKAYALLPASPKDILHAQAWLATSAGQAFEAAAKAAHDARVAAASGAPAPAASPFG